MNEKGAVGLKMNKTDFAVSLAERTGLTTAEALRVVDASLDIIKETLAKGDIVRFTGFGTFSAENRGMRIGRNPKTREEIQIPAKRVPSFKAGSELKAAVAIK